MKKPKNHLSNNKLVLQKISLIRRFILTLMFIISSLIIFSQGVSDMHKIAGYYEGEFMPGNNFTLILVFEINDEVTISGRVLLYQGNAELQDDLLKDIVLDGDQLSFMIEVKDTPFKGVLSPDKTQIKGEFLFPDGSLQPVLVHKVVTPSYVHLSTGDPASQTNNSLEKVYSTEELQKDFQFLRNNMENTHPQLYAFNSKEQFNKIFDSVYQSINTEMKQDAFFRLIAPVVANVKCSHTGIRFSNEFMNVLNSQEHLLPLDIRFFNDKAYIIINFSPNDQIIPGTQILSINGMPIETVHKQLISCIPSDGNNITAKYYEMNTDFAIVFSLYIGNYEEFELLCLTPEKEKISVYVEAISSETYKKAKMNAYPQRYPTGPLPIALSIVEESSVAVLTVLGFWAPDWEVFHGFLNETFENLKVKKIRSLIVDVRGNKGGHPFFAAELLSYLTKEPFTYFVLPEDKGELAPLYEPMPVENNCFSGDIYLLVDGGCLSTTGHFISLMDYHQLATIIGEEPGSSFSCNDGSIQIELPHTKIQLNLPQATYQTAVTDYTIEKGLLPDFMIVPTLEDLLDGRDAQMEYAIELINAK